MSPTISTTPASPTTPTKPRIARGLRRAAAVAVAGPIAALVMAPGVAHAQVQSPAECRQQAIADFRAHMAAIEEAGWGSPHYAVLLFAIDYASC